MLRRYLASRDSPSFIRADRAVRPRRDATVRPYICPSVCIALTTRLFGRTFMHPSFWPCARARSVRRTGPALAALYHVRGVADLTEGVVAPVRLGPLSPHHVFLSFSILLLVSFACTRARPDLSSRQRLASTIAVCDGRSSSFLPLSFPLSFSFSYYYSLSSIPLLPSPLLLPPARPGLLRSYPTYCPFRSNPGCVAGSKRNYSYLPPTLSDSRLFRGSRPSHHPSLPPLALLPLLFSFFLCTSSLSSIFNCD